MMKNIVILITCVAIVGILWWSYQFIGDWLLLIFFVIAIVSLIKNSKKSKFSKRDDS